MLLNRARVKEGHSLTLRDATDYCLARLFIDPSQLQHKVSKRLNTSPIQLLSL